MEFLLFLCAALTALTGAMTGARAPGVEVQIARVAGDARTAAPLPRRAVAAIVQAQRLPEPEAVRTLLAERPFGIIAVVPLFADRRRE